jgi:hypothetical protein
VTARAFAQTSANESGKLSFKKNGEAHLLERAGWEMTQKVQIRWMPADKFTPGTLGVYVDNRIQYLVEPGKDWTVHLENGTEIQFISGKPQSKPSPVPQSQAPGNS